jgi:two-component system, sensor histidine kinase
LLTVDEGLVMKSDENRITQVLYNLIINTIDFVDSGIGEVLVYANRGSDGIHFGVKDNGVGISKENIKNLFQKFHQLDTSNRRSHQGSGLGLSICKGIVEKLGGKIWVDSEGKGSNFQFTLPIEVER